jgi:hypothetical protein
VATTTWTRRAADLFEENDVANQKPDPEAAARDPKAGAEDRPGFDLGGAKDRSGTGSNVVPGGPKGSPAAGGSASGRASGLTDPSGSRSLGNEGDTGSASGSGPTDGVGGPH